MHESKCPVCVSQKKSVTNDYQLFFCCTMYYLYILNSSSNNNKKWSHHAIPTIKVQHVCPSYKVITTKTYPKEVMSGHRKCSGRRPHVHTDTNI